MGLFFGWFDPLYFVFLAPGVLLAMWATFKTKATFAKYSQVASRSGLTGARAAEEMLRRQGITGVRIEPTQGFLSDHYDPRDRTLRLPPSVYSSRSLAAVGIACHEAGHAIQHAHNYAPLTMRSTLVPVTQACSSLWSVLLIAGILVQMAAAFTLAHTLFLLAVCVFAVTVVFSLVTLPVEWDASARAKEAMMTQGLLAPDEVGDASKVLNAAFMTYVASAVTSILILLYYMYRLGLIGGRRD